MENALQFTIQAKATISAISRAHFISMPGGRQIVRIYLNTNFIIKIVAGNYFNWMATLLGIGTFLGAKWPKRMEPNGIAWINRHIFLSSDIRNYSNYNSVMVHAHGIGTRKQARKWCLCFVSKWWRRGDKLKSPCTTYQRSPPPPLSLSILVFCREMGANAKSHFTFLCFIAFWPLLELDSCPKFSGRFTYANIR